MTLARDEVLHTIWGELDPFTNYPRNLYATDLQGWASNNPLLVDTVKIANCKLIVEIGVWKGGSVITMAETVKALSYNSAIVAVDTFLGAYDHWVQAEWFDHLRVVNGYPQLYHTFMTNICSKGLVEFVVPLPTDSLNAAAIFRHYSLLPGLVHIDAGHDYRAVSSDLEAWWAIVAPGGWLIGDDYHEQGAVWPEVRQAFQDFFKTKDIENYQGKCRIRKEN